MKVKANKIHLVLGIVALTQMGCNGSSQQRGQYLYPNVATQAQDLTTTGDAFRSTAGAGTQGNLANLFNGMARGANNQGQPTMTQAELEAAAAAKIKAEQAAKEKAEKDGTDEVKSDAETFKVVIDDEAMSIKSCKKFRINMDGDDKDGDGISDECEKLLTNKTELQNKIVEYIVENKIDQSKINMKDEVEKHYIPTLDPEVFNGAIISAKQFVKEPAGLLGNKKADDSATSILLTEEENNLYKSSELSKFGSGVDSKFDRQAAKKFVAISRKNKSDLQAFKALYNLNQEYAKKKYGDDFNPFLPVIDYVQASDRGRDTGFGSLNAKFGLVRAGIQEMIPFALDADGEFVSDLAGLASVTDELQKNEEFVYLAETHLYVPAGGIQLRIGQLVSDRTNAIAGAKSGMFYVMVGSNHSAIVASDLIANTNKNNEDLKKSKGNIPVPTRCSTIHLVIAYFADSNKIIDDINAKTIFAESVFYQDKSSKDWKPLPQEWMRLQALNKSATSTCEVKDNQILFDEASSVLKQAKNPS